MKNNAVPSDLIYYGSDPLEINVILKGVRFIEMFLKRYQTE